MNWADCFHWKVINVQTKWINYLRKKHNYKKVLELVWDQLYMAIAVDMQNHRKGARNSL